MESELPHTSSARVRNNCIMPSRNPVRSDKPQSKSSIFSFDVLRSDPSASSLQHIASSATFPNRGSSSSGYTPQAQSESPDGSVLSVTIPDHEMAMRGVGQSPPSRSRFINASRSPENARVRFTTSTRAGYSAGLISFPAGPTGSAQRSRARSPDDPDGNDDDLSGSNGKKHVCSTCSKRFNRPSSLRIHVNTHTGATPFRCLWPNCAREFNVNSNMRRHYRNHTSPGVLRPQAVDNRRRRKGWSSHNLVFIPGDSHIDSHSTSFGPPISSLPMDEGSDGSDNGNYQGDEEDELDSLPGAASPVYPSKKACTSTRRSRLSDRDRYDKRASFSRYSQSHMRSGHSDQHSASSSPSSSPSPPLLNYTYSPSSPCSRPFADHKA
ncbi:hypothetical protein C0991_008657 [Blastosporella zonata]|nr:hypothetical protein C0991_008657 [Blastosporella zonata]